MLLVVHNTLADIHGLIELIDVVLVAERRADLLLDYGVKRLLNLIGKRIQKFELLPDS